MTTGRRTDVRANGARAASARRAIDAYGQEQWGTTYSGAPPEDKELIVSDFLADMMHFLDRERMGFDEVVDRARMHYEAETADVGKLLWAITETPDDPSLNPCMIVEASNALEALDAYCDKFELARYTDTLYGDSGLTRDEKEGVIGFLEDGTVWATFTNTTLFAIPFKV